MLVPLIDRDDNVVVPKHIIASSPAFHGIVIDDTASFRVFGEGLEEVGIEEVHSVKIDFEVMVEVPGNASVKSDRTRVVLTRGRS